MHDHTIGVINVQARTFMREQVACPFKTAQKLVDVLRQRTSLILVDFHGEATSEKMGLAYYLDGQISALVGTHTHVLTNDARIYYLVAPPILPTWVWQAPLIQ